MIINIKATNIELTTAIRDYVEKKVQTLSNFTNTEGDRAECQVEVGKVTKHHQKGDLFRAEINIGVNGKQFYASAEESDLYASIDKVQEEIKAEIKRAKGKKESLFKRGARNFKDALRGIKNLKK